MERGHSPEMLIVLQELRRQAGIGEWRLAVAHDGSQKESEKCHIRQHHEEQLVHRRVRHPHAFLCKYLENGFGLLGYQWNLGKLRVQKQLDSKKNALEWVRFTAQRVKHFPKCGHHACASEVCSSVVIQASQQLQDMSQVVRQFGRFVNARLPQFFP